MARPKSYRELIVWQKAMALARRTYAITQGLPKSEAYGLLSQIRRAAVSVPSNIAEGHGRLTDSQFRHFLGNARGSLSEMQTQLELASDLGYLDKGLVHEAMEHGAEVARLINGLVSSMGRGRSVEGMENQPTSPTPLAARENTANSAISANTASMEFNHEDTD
ncbi:MAG: four helix bundle protein [Terracidiphilus sp.]